MTDLDVLVRNLSDASSEFLRHRLSWKEFALTLEETCDDLELEMEDVANYHKKVKVLLKRAYKIAGKLLLEIDSGNMKEAEETARRLTSRG